MARRECSVEKRLLKTHCRCSRRGLCCRTQKLEVPKSPTSQLPSSCLGRMQTQRYGSLWSGPSGYPSPYFGCYLQAPSSYWRRHCWSPVEAVLCRRSRRLTTATSVQLRPGPGVSGVFSARVDTSFKKSGCAVVWSKPTPRRGLGAWCTARGFQPLNNPIKHLG